MPFSRFQLTPDRAIRTGLNSIVRHSFALHPPEAGIGLDPIARGDYGLFPFGEGTKRSGRLPTLGEPDRCVFSSGDFKYHNSMRD